MRRHPRLALAATATVGAMVMTACAGGGSSDVVGAADAQQAAAKTSTINLYAYAVPKPGFDKVIPAFTQTPAGKGVQFQQSYGPSGDQSRKVAAGAGADFVNFSVEPDITRLVDAGLVAEDWNANPYKGVPFGSVVTIVVRKGNPKGIHDWGDLLKPGVEVVTPNPFSSGSAKWNLLAPYAAKSNGGKDPKAGLAFIDQLVSGHVKVQPKSGREATETFLQGTGDVLLSYENEALFAERKGDPVQHVTPPTTFKIENPTAVVSSSKNLAAATAFNAFLFTPQAQRLWAQAGFRPVDPTVAKEFAAHFPQPQKLWTIDDLGGWKTVDSTLFKKETGSIAVIYDKATSQPMTTATTTTAASRGDDTQVPSPPARPPTDPGFSVRRLSSRPLGVGLVGLWLSVIVLLPLAALTVTSFGDGLSGFWDAVTAPVALASLAVTVGVAAVVALVNAVMGTLVAWVLVRDEFPGKRVVNALIDLPFALPTIVASIVLLSLYGPNSPIHVHLNATRPGLVVALAFVTLPFVVRSVQPVLIEADREVEEASASLGASSWTTFRRVVLPTLAPAVISGTGLAFARAIGEYGSVVLIGGNIPRKTQVASQYIQQQIEIDQPVNAAAVSVALLAIAFATLFVLRLVAGRSQRREEETP